MNCLIKHAHCMVIMFPGEGSPSQSAEGDSDSDFELPAVNFRSF